MEGKGKWEVRCAGRCIKTILKRAHLFLIFVVVSVERGIVTKKTIKQQNLPSTSAGEVGSAGIGPIGCTCVAVCRNFAA